MVKRTGVFGLSALLAATLLATQAVAATAQPLLCHGREQTVCRGAACAVNMLFTSLSLDTNGARVEYCIGEGCYQAQAVMVKAMDGSVSFAFNARRAGPEANDFFDGLATVHPGRRWVSVGRFFEDGSVAFSRLDCQP